jgi:type I restriction enzyme S subunit
MEQALYELPEGWEWSTVDNLSSRIQYGHTTKATEAGNAKFLRITDIQNGYIQWDNVPFVSISEKDIDKYRLQENDLVFARSGATAGKSILIEKPPLDAIFASYLIRIIPSPRYIFPRFLALFFQSPNYWKQVDINAEGAAQPNINGSKLAKFSVPLPTLDEQKRIVTTLDALFTRIDTAIAHLQETLELAKALFASVLVQPFKENKAWVRMKIKDIFNVVNGRAYKQAELLEGGKYKVVRIQNLKGGTNYYYSDLELQENKYCSDGDLLFSWSGTPGTSFGAFIWEGEKSIFHYHIWNMEPIIDLDIRFGYWLLRDLTEEAIAKSRGVAGMLHITKGMMEAFEVQIPSSKEAQRRVAEHLDALSERTSNLEAFTEEKLSYLNALKASLLDAAFRGQL